MRRQRTSIASPAARRRKPSETANKSVTRTVSVAKVLREKLLRDLSGVLGRCFGTFEQLP
jgi:hypothetical protein